MIFYGNSDRFYIRDEFENFICPECGLKFVTSVEVDRHLRQHTGEDTGSLDFAGNSLESTEELNSNADKSDNSTVAEKRLSYFDESSLCVEIVKDFNQYENPTSCDLPIGNVKLETPFGNKRSEQFTCIGNNGRPEQPIGNKRSEKPIGNKRSEQPICFMNGRSEQPIGNEHFEHQPIKDEYSIQPIKTENHEHYVNGNLFEHVVKRESDLPVDYEIPMDLIEHLKTTTYTGDQANTHCLESQNNFSECMGDSRLGILYPEPTDNHQPIQELKITNVQSRDSSILCSTVTKGVVTRYGEQLATHSYSGTSSQRINHLTEIPNEASTLQIPEKEIPCSMSVQNPTCAQSPEVGSTGPPEDISEPDTTLEVLDGNTPELRLDHVPEAAGDDPNQDDPTHDLPVLEKFTPLKNKTDSFPTMPHLEPALPLKNLHKDSNSETSWKKKPGSEKGSRIGQMKKQVVSKCRKTRQYVCESFHCYKTFFSNAGLQKHMIKFHPGYVPVSARVFQAPHPKPKSNKPKTVKRVHFSEKNQIHIIEPIFNLPHGKKNGKYVCLKCRGVFDDTLDLREHLKEFKNKLHCDKIQRSKKKVKRKFQNNVKVRQNQTVSGDIPKASGLLDTASEPTVESNLQEMDTNECASDTADPKMYSTDLPNTISEDSELFLTRNSKIISDNGKQSFACLKCSKIFFYKKSLKNHLKAHNDFDYRCEFCPSTFDSKKRLNKHVHSEHKDEFLCPICHAKYSYQKSLRNHMKKKHKLPQS